VSFAIITDSTANLLPEQVAAEQIGILPLELTVDGELVDGAESGSPEFLSGFYQRMRQDAKVSTALVPLGTVDKVVRPLFEAGQDVLYIGFDSALSGTYAAASVYIRDLAAAEFPKRRFIAIDSLAAAFGHGLLVMYACKLRAEGQDFDQVASWVEAHRLNIAHWFTVDDLKYLQRGGRLSKGVQVVGTILNIKPVLHVDDLGRLVPVSMARGRRKSLRTIIDHFGDAAKQPYERQMVTISHGDCLADAEFVADQLRERFGVKDIHINVLDPVIGAHAGPGTFALFFYSADAR
jgi:DegV family protein with EDD domain